MTTNKKQKRARREAMGASGRSYQSELQAAETPKQPDVPLGCQHPADKQEISWNGYGSPFHEVQKCLACGSFQSTPGREILDYDKELARQIGLIFAANDAAQAYASPTKIPIGWEEPEACRVRFHQLPSVILLEVNMTCFERAWSGKGTLRHLQVYRDFDAIRAAVVLTIPRFQKAIQDEQERLTKLAGVLVGLGLT